jgi:tetratricopeptide (TPR) repeat protein
MDSYQRLKLDEIFFEADVLIAEKKFSDAINLLEGILIEAPAYGKAYNHLGWIYETKYKDYKKAEDFYKKCLLYSPDYPAIYLNLSVVLSSTGKFDELAILLNQALTTVGVDKAAIHSEFGIMYELQGEFTKAIESYKSAIKCSLSQPNIDIYAGSLARCKNKIEILK